MSMLPKVPINELGEPVERFLIEFSRQLERELARRPATQADGVLYFHEGQVVRLVSPNGTVYELTVNNAGGLVTTQVTP